MNPYLKQHGVDQETKRKIIELYFAQHKNIREIAKEVQKSSRDVVAMVKEHKQELQQSQPSMSAGDDVDQQIEEASIEPPVSVKAYELFVKGSTPLQVSIRIETLRRGYYKVLYRVRKAEEITQIRLIS